MTLIKNFVLSTEAQLNGEIFEPENTSSKILLRRESCSPLRSEARFDQTVYTLDGSLTKTIKKPFDRLKVTN